MYPLYLRGCVASDPSFESKCLCSLYFALFLRDSGNRCWRAACLRCRIDNQTGIAYKPKETPTPVIVPKFGFHPPPLHTQTPAVHITNQQCRKTLIQTPKTQLSHAGGSYYFIDAVYCRISCLSHFLLVSSAIVNQ